MTLLYRNVIFNTLRPTFSGGATSIPTTHLTGVYGHVDRPTMTTPGPNGIIKRQYKFIVETGTDIAIGDILTNITLLDGTTPWPNEVNTSKETWIVRDSMEVSALILGSRELVVERLTTGGTTHL